MSGPYDDIINLPHHVSRTRPQMPRADRAAQFAPFSALGGYGAALVETARLTDRRIELEEDDRAAMDRKQQKLMERIGETGGGGHLVCARCTKGRRAVHYHRGTPEADR